jgi:tetratricopeptide (TPR) repeat protein
MGSRDVTLHFLDNFFGKKEPEKNQSDMSFPPSIVPELERPSDEEYAYGPGDYIAGRYEVVKVSSGGMGVVYFCADQDQQQRPLALKTFKPEYLSNPKIRDHFLREGTIWVGLAHPNIVRAYRVERIGDGREVYLVLAWVAAAEGKEDASLRAWLESEEPLTVEQALLFALHIARGMRYATKKIPGLVHRDLKPENVLVGRDDNAKVTDFGLARSLAGLDQDRIQTGAVAGKFRRTMVSHGVVGTPLYMAPEQWIRGKPVDVRTDIYAFGCILYEMVTGQTAVKGDSLDELAEAHTQGKVGEIPSHLPIEVRALIQRCLSLNPEDRCQSWQEVADATTIIYERVAGKSAPVEIVIQNKGKQETREELISAGWSYHAMGLSYYDIGKYDLAAGYFERVIWIAQQQKHPPLEAAGLNHLGNLCCALSDVTGAIKYHKRQLKIVRELGNQAEEADAMGNLGNDYAKLGDIRAALVYYKQQISIAQELGDSIREARALRNLGDASREMGRSEEAIKFYNYALTQFKKNKDRANEGRLLSSMGLAYAQLGDVKQAMTLYEQALQIAQEISDRIGQGMALGYIGLAYSDQGHQRQAVSYLMKYWSIVREAGLRFEEARALNKLGNIYFEADKPTQALEFFKDCLKIVRKLGDQFWLANVLRQLGDCHRELGEIDQAIGYYEEYLAVTKAVESPIPIAKALYILGNAYRDMRESKRAQSCYEEALQITEKLKDDLLTANISLDFAMLLAWEGYRDEARQYIETAIKIFREKKDKDALRLARQVLANIRRQKRR